MKKSDMLECLINYYTDGNKAKFAATIGVKPQTVSAWMARNSFDAELIYSKCRGVSADWLLGNGDGEMIKGGNTVTASGDCSVAVGGNNSSVSVGADASLYRERISHLEDLLSEKERLIKVLMEKK